MSYCRWSSMNWRSDVYVYEDVSGGWTTHVAARRRIVPPIPDLPFCGRVVSWCGGRWDREQRRIVYASRLRAACAWAWFGFAAFWYSRVHMGSLNLIPLRPIGLPFDGESFNDPSPGECASRLEWLRGLGYVVPSFAIEALREEQKDCESQ